MKLTEVLISFIIIILVISAYMKESIKTSKQLHVSQKTYATRVKENTFTEEQFASCEILLALNFHNIFNCSNNKIILINAK